MSEEFQLPDEVITLPLKEGEVYKNYKELCKALGEEVKSGNAKQNQLKHWQMHFDYEREGYKYHIIKIIEPNYKRWYTNKNSRNTKPHSELIQKLLLNLVYDYSKRSNFSSDTNDVILSNKLIAEMLAMVNKSYYHYYAKTKLLAKELALNVELAQDFYMRYTSMFTNDIKTALRQLESRKLIYVEEVTLYREYLTPELTGYEKEMLNPQEQREAEEYKRKSWEEKLSEDEQHFTFKFGEYKIATPKIIKKIVETEHATMKSLGASNTQAIMAMGIFPRYQKYVVTQLRDFYGIAYYFKAHRIVFSPSLLQYIAKNGNDIVTLSETEEIASKVALNKIMQNNIESQYQRYEDSLKYFLENGDYFGEYYPMLPPSEKIMHDNSMEDVQRLLKAIVFLE